MRQNTDVEVSLQRQMLIPVVQQHHVVPPCKMLCQWRAFACHPYICVAGFKKKHRFVTYHAGFRGDRNLIGLDSGTAVSTRQYGHL